MKATLKSAMILILMLLLNATAFAQTAYDQTAAENLALEAAGATRERALLFPTEIETEHGQLVYDVEFQCDGFEYEYWISTTDGAIVKRAWTLTSEKTLEMAAYQDAAAALIGEQQALAKALADAGLTEADVTLIEISLDTDDALRLYEIDFYTSTAEYDYDVDAVSGAVCGVSIEYFAESEAVRPGQRLSTSESASAAQAISREKARSIALSDAGLSNATFTKTKLDREDGVPVYEIEFVTTDAEYEYEIDASTGAIRERSLEARATAQPSSSSYIGVDQAKSIALKHAGLSAAEVSFSKAKLEKDDGLRKYEIEFFKGNTEYEYEIDAASGSIIEYKAEQEEPAAPAQSKAIFLEQARSTALKHAGLSASNVSFTKAKLDDGKYEIEFVSGDTEYEYEIDAASGSIIEYKAEQDKPDGNDRHDNDHHDDDDHDDDDHDDDDD